MVIRFRIPLLASEVIIIKVLSGVDINSGKSPTGDRRPATGDRPGRSHGPGVGLRTGDCMIGAVLDGGEAIMLAHRAARCESVTEAGRRSTSPA